MGLWLRTGFFENLANWVFQNSDLGFSVLHKKNPCHTWTQPLCLRWGKRRAILGQRKLANVQLWQDHLSSGDDEAAAHHQFRHLTEPPATGLQPGTGQEEKEELGFCADWSLRHPFGPSGRQKEKIRGGWLHRYAGQLCQNQRHFQTRPTCQR